MSSFLKVESGFKKLGLRFIAGIDEVGRGSLAGPVVSAAVILKENAKLPGLADSKLLTKQKREKLFKLIIKNSLDFAISFVTNEIIDEHNITEATKFANLLCVKYLKYIPDIALIDGIDKQYLQIPFKTIIKGDSKVRSIAAASIIAKVARDRVMEEFAKEYNNYGFERHVGYGTREHRSNIKKFGYCDIHRKSFTFKPV
jgi:ribonuclease HII